MRALVERGDVLVSTVGPFLRWGEPALEAAIGAGAHYLDSTGEGAFIRRVFEEFGPRAERADIGLLTAMGYDWVPGNLAGALALRGAGAEARRVEIAYFTTGGVDDGRHERRDARERRRAWRSSRGTRSQGGRVVTERGARRVRAFELSPGREAPGRVGRLQRAVHAAAAAPRAARGRHVPRLVRPGLAAAAGLLGGDARSSRRCRASRAGSRRVAGRLVKGSTGGPDAAAARRSRGR